jgi:hypothetical protein
VVFSRFVSGRTQTLHMMASQNLKLERNQDPTACSCRHSAMCYKCICITAHRM